MKPKITVITIGVDDLEASLRFTGWSGFLTEGVIDEFERGPWYSSPCNLVCVWRCVRRSIAHDTGLVVGPAS